MLITSIPWRNTICKVFHACDTLYKPASLVLWELNAVVVNCDILISSGTPTNFSNGPHFCAELEVLDHINPQNVLNSGISTYCALKSRQTVEWAASPPNYFGYPGNQWPVLCPEIGSNELDSEIREDYGWAGNIKFRKMISGKPFVVVEYFSSTGLRENLTVAVTE